MRPEKVSAKIKEEKANAMKWVDVLKWPMLIVVGAIIVISLVIWLL